MHPHNTDAFFFYNSPEKLCKYYSKRVKYFSSTRKMGKEEILYFPLRVFVFSFKGKYIFLKGLKISP